MTSVGKTQNALAELECDILVHAIGLAIRFSQ
jgi:hypothetical protein